MRQLTVVALLLVVMGFCMADVVLNDEPVLLIRAVCQQGENRLTIPFLKEAVEYSFGPNTSFPEGIYFVPHGDTEVTIGVAGTVPVGTYKGVVEVIIHSTPPGVPDWQGPTLALTALIPLEVYVSPYGVGSSAAPFLHGRQDVILKKYP